MKPRIGRPPPPKTASTYINYTLYYTCVSAMDTRRSSNLSPLIGSCFSSTMSPFFSCSPGKVSPVFKARTKSLRSSDSSSSSFSMSSSLVSSRGFFSWYVSYRGFISARGASLKPRRLPFGVAPSYSN